MDNRQSYTLQEAVLLMKRLSKANKTFTLTFMKRTGGRSILKDYRLISKNTKTDTLGAYKLQFINDNDARKSAYIPLLMTLNGIKIQ